MSFNPGNGTGTLGQGGLKTVSSNIDPPIPDSAIDYFEDGDITVRPTDWTGWSGDTANLTAQQSVVLAGDYTGQLDATSGNISVVDAAPDTAEAVSESECLFRANSRSGSVDDNFRFGLLKSGTQFAEILLQSDGSLSWGGATSISGSWSTSTTYRIRYYNIDYTNDVCDFELIDTSNDNVIASDTNRDFINSVSVGDADEMRLIVDSRDGGADQSGYYDNIEWKV
jgi:hypothetical protein